MSTNGVRARQRAAMLVALVAGGQMAIGGALAADREIQINLRPSDALRSEAVQVMLQPKTQVVPGARAVPQVRRGAAAKPSQPVAKRAAPAAVPRSAPAATPAAAPSSTAIDLDEKFAVPNGLPTELAPEDLALYRQIFSAQASGDWDDADTAIAKLGNDILLGYVQAQRFLHPEHKTTYTALASWLRSYHGLPDAPAIYRLALARRPKGADAPTAASFVARVPYSPAFALTRTVIGGDAGRAYALRARLEQMLARDDDDQLKKVLEESETQDLLGADEIAHWRGRLLTRAAEAKDDARARARGLAAGTSLARTNFTTGLGHWRRGDFAKAEQSFAAVADTPADQATSWTLSAGAFWAARAAQRAGDQARYEAFLTRAALHDRTFYGQLALQLLGREPAMAWSKPELDSSLTARLRGNEATRRALALLQLGQGMAAGRELFSASVRADTRTVEAVLALSVEARLPMASLQISSVSFDSRAGIDGFDAASFPLPPWQPDEGFVLDRSLLFAFMRQESAFNTRARSSAGAMGLMQLMPGTAAFVVRGFLPHRMGSNVQDPGFNFTLGQQYLLHLLDNDNTDDLIRLAAAYNGGPGNVARWDANRENGQDPLLWIESIPLDETRDYVQRVLANYWLYANQLGQPTPSLDEVAAGQWPRYVPQDRPHGTPAARVRAAAASGEASASTCLPRKGLQRPYMF